MDSLLYRQELLDHAQNPRNYGAVKHPHFQAEDTNVFCGDRIRMTGRLDQSGKISDVRFEGEGCAISQAAASLLTEALKGRALNAVEDWASATMLNLMQIELSPIRLKCALLPLVVAQQAWRGYTGTGRRLSLRHCEPRTNHFAILPGEKPRRAGRRSKPRL